MVDEDRWREIVRGGWDSKKWGEVDEDSKRWGEVAETELMTV